MQPNEGASQRFFGALRSRSKELSAAGVEGLWFLHKPPGLRLRIGARALTPSTNSVVDRMLEEWVREGTMVSSFCSIYEPEAFQFGGPEAMELVHRHFTEDTRAWLEWSRLREHSPPRVTTLVVSLAAMVDLFERTIRVSEEIWDVWMNVAKLYEGASSSALDVPAIGLRELESIGGAALLRLCDIYRAANAAFADGLADLWRRGALSSGRRGILPFVAIFHWNRFGVDPESIARLAGAMSIAYDPKAGLTGRAMDVCR